MWSKSLGGKLFGLGCWIAGVTLLVPGPRATADVVELRNGQRIEGKATVEGERVRIRIAEDRATQCRRDDVLEEVRKRLRDESGTRGDFSRVHACAPGSDIPDEMEARLVILGPEHLHTAKSSASPARQEAAAILDSRGSTPRNYRNTLVFLAADDSRLSELEQSVRQYLAWDSIWKDRGEESLNLDPFQSGQAETKRNDHAELHSSPFELVWSKLPLMHRLHRFFLAGRVHSRL